MHTFHVADLGPDRIVLPEAEAGHALRVLRLRDGERVMLTDGRGTKAWAELHSIGKHQAELVVQERTIHPPEPSAGIHLAVAVTKQMERYEWFLEKATELGVGRITPLLTARSERGHLRYDRLTKVLVSAMKQSQRAWLPALSPLTPMQDLLGSSAPQRYFGWCEGRPVPLAQVYEPVGDALVLIGPEGDFTPAEALALQERGFLAVGLGEARLRTETAAVAACAWMNLRAGRS